MGDWTPVTVAQNQELQPTLAHSLGTIAGDNPTPFYLNFPDMPPGMQWVLPFTYAFSYPLPLLLPKQQRFRIWSDQTAPGFPVAPASTANATLAALEDVLPYSAGLRPQTSQGWTFVGSFTITNGSATTNPVPPTAKSLMLILPNNATLGAGQATVDGVQSGARYFSSPIGTIQGQTLVPINGLEDSTYKITANQLGGITVDIYASDTPVGQVSAGQMVMARSLPVVLASDQSAVAMLGSTRWVAASSGNFAIGTYTFDIPVLVAGSSDSFVQGNGTLTVAKRAGFAPTGRAVLYCLVGGNAGGGTCTFGIQDREPVTGASTGNILATTALAANATSVLRVAPGLTAVANATANDTIGLAPRVQVVVATAAQAFTFALDLF